MSTHLRRVGVATAATTLALGLVWPGAGVAQDYSPGKIEIQLLAINDFHGNLEPPRGGNGTIVVVGPGDQPVAVPAGGVAYLATHLARARRGHPHSFTVGAGDLIGGSPPLSAAFHDEPTIQALRLAKLDVSAVGNHELDEGRAELQRIAYGGCREDVGCYDPDHPYDGSGFTYLAANVIDTSNKLPMLLPVWIERAGSAKIGFIGATLAATPSLIGATAAQGLNVVDEVRTINFYASTLRLAGVQAIVVLIHQGGSALTPGGDFDCDWAGPRGSGPHGLRGPIAEIARTLDSSIDLIVTGHSHKHYVCRVPDPAGHPRLVTGASSYGRMFTDVEATFDVKTQDFVRTSMTAENMIVTRDVPPDPAQVALIARYRDLLRQQPPRARSAELEVHHPDR